MRYFRLPVTYVPQQGQVLLIVVLVMVVALTVGLSVATRSITNVRTTTEEDNSQRAFSAAEAGVERAIKNPATNITSPLSLGNNANISQVSVGSLVAGNSYVLNPGSVVKQNEGGDVSFVSHAADGSLNYTSPWPTDSTSATVRVSWGVQNSCPSAPAMEMVFISYTGGQLVTSHQVFDPCSRSNNFAGLGGSFTQGNYSAGTQTVHYQVTFTNRSNLVLLRLIPLYAPSVISVFAVSRGGQSLPTQGSLISSTGESGETFRKLQVNNPFPQIPPELFTVLFAPGDN